jgi:hypothetical protein
MPCVGFLFSGRDSCQGDSVGPVTRGSANMTLTGAAAGLRMPAVRPLSSELTGRPASSKGRKGDV